MTVTCWTGEVAACSSFLKDSGNTENTTFTGFRLFIHSTNMEHLPDNCAGPKGPHQDTSNMKTCSWQGLRVHNASSGRGSFGPTHQRGQTFKEATDHLSVGRSNWLLPRPSRICPVPGQVTQHQRQTQRISKFLCFHFIFSPPSLQASLLK